MTTYRFKLDRLLSTVNQSRKVSGHYELPCDCVLRPVDALYNFADAADRERMPRSPACPPADAAATFVCRLRLLLMLRHRQVGFCSRNWSGMDSAMGGQSLPASRYFDCERPALRKAHPLTRWD